MLEEIGVLIINIAGWIETAADASTHLRIGIWDVAQDTWYATIHNADDEVMIGESSYGAASLVEALTDCWQEIQDQM